MDQTHYKMTVESGINTGVPSTIVSAHRTEKSHHALLIEFTCTRVLQNLLVALAAASDSKDGRKLAKAKIREAAIAFFIASTIALNGPIPASNTLIRGFQDATPIAVDPETVEKFVLMACGIKGKVEDQGDEDEGDEDEGIPEEFAKFIENLGLNGSDF